MDDANSQLETGFESICDRIWRAAPYLILFFDTKLFTNSSDAIEAVLQLLQFDSHIHERAYRNRPLTDTQKAQNRERSRIRAKVEHVFGSWTMTMGGKLLRCIGIEPVTVQLGLKHLTYNFKRLLFWQAQSVPAA